MLKRMKRRDESKRGLTQPPRQEEKESLNLSAETS